MNTKTEKYAYRKTVEGLNPGVKVAYDHMIDQVNVVLTRTVVESD